MKDNMTLLVTEAKKGSQAAYEALYQKTKQMVYFTCFGLLKSEADAADQMQEAYATAFQKLDMLDDPEKFPGWINRIAINKCKDFLIQQKRWLLLSEEKDISEELPETEEDFLPEEYLMRQDMREIVQKIMQKELSDVQYRTVLLYYYDGLSLSEIAEWMDCSEGTVKSRLYKAKELIKTGMQKYSQKHDDKLYSIAALPFLLRFFQMEAEKLRAPELNPDHLQNTKEPNPAYQQDPKQDVKQKQRKGRLQMGQKGLSGTTAGKIIATVVTLLVIVGGIIGFSAIANHSKQVNDNHENNSQGSGTRGDDGEEETDDPEIADLISQISFTDAATGEDYLSGHIMSIKFLLGSDNKFYLVLDDAHNLYKCTQQSDVSDIYKEGDKIQWDIELMYADVRLDTIEDVWEISHYNPDTGDIEEGADGHKKCVVIYGNGYMYKDGEEYDLNAIVPISKLTEYWDGVDNILIIDTSGKLHYWQGRRGLDTLINRHPEYELVGFLDYFEAPLCEELREAENCVDLNISEVLLSDGKLVATSSPVNTETWDYFDVDAYTFEERIVSEGIKAIYSGGNIFEDTEGRIIFIPPYLLKEDRREEYVDCDYEGEILNIYSPAMSQMELLVQTTEGFYYSDSCCGTEYDPEPEPFRKLTVLESTSSPIKEYVEEFGGSEVKFFFLLEDGTVWGFIDGESYDHYYGGL